MSRKPIRGAALAAALLLGAVAGAAAKAAAAPFWITPTIAGAGKMHPLPNGAYRPVPGETYKVVFLITHGGAKPTDIDPGLEHVARAVNLYVWAGVPLDHLKFVAIIAGPPTRIALDDAHYKQKFGVDNPNLALIAELRKAGVDVAVCGQAVAEANYKYRWVAQGVTLALSALTTVTALEHDGYGLVPM
ncbi:MAG TPA: DsrE family protein [Steroidobacteraceae bacterium]|nr:DsrE family protein [Steroidobacteraceae bacterium]